MTKYAFAINLHRCIGCRTCTVSCKMENHVADGICRIPVYNDAGETDASLDAPSGTYPNVTFLWRPTPCQHCDNAPCVEVCPTGASSKREDGVVVVDKEACIGCEKCAEACPYHARSLDVEAQVIDKCEMCI
ncbi:MAG: 4Fe-4S dicluster domain-containing protein, partial [Slackia isoflavoniconvertens]|nr:4Fe-4S dicluster domain-containing protein [Slackia isoflavoniconvertens]